MLSSVGRVTVREGRVPQGVDSGGGFQPAGCRLASHRSTLFLAVFKNADPPYPISAWTPSRTTNALYPRVFLHPSILSPVVPHSPEMRNRPTPGTSLR